MARVPHTPNVKRPPSSGEKRIGQMTEMTDAAQKQAHSVPPRARAIIIITIIIMYVGSEIFQGIQDGVWKPCVTSSRVKLLCLDCNVIVKRSKTTVITDHRVIKDHELRYRPTTPAHTYGHECQSV